MNKREQQRRRIAPREVTPGDVARAYQAVFASEDGTIVVADLLRRFGYARRSTLDENRPDPLLMAKAEGQRTVLQHIGYMQDVDPAAYEKSSQQTGER